MIQAESEHLSELAPTLPWPQFVAFSFVVALVLGGLVFLANQVMSLGLDLETSLTACSAAFVVGTVGWAVVRRGGTGSSDKMLISFGTGMATKAVLLFVTVGVVKWADRVDLGSFLVTFGLVFLLLGFAQLILWVKEVSKGMNDMTFEPGEYQPTAPGVAVDRDGPSEA